MTLQQIRKINLRMRVLRLWVIWVLRVMLLCSLKTTHVGVKLSFFRNFPCTVATERRGTINWPWYDHVILDCLLWVTSLTLLQSADQSITTSQVCKRWIGSCLTSMPSICVHKGYGYCLSVLYLRNGDIEWVLFVVLNCDHVPAASIYLSELEHWVGHPQQQTNPGWAQRCLLSASYFVVVYFV